MILHRINLWIRINNLFQVPWRMVGFLVACIAALLEFKQAFLLFILLFTCTGVLHQHKIVEAILHMLFTFYIMKNHIYPWLLLEETKRLLYILIACKTWNKTTTLRNSLEEKHSYLDHVLFHDAVRKIQSWSKYRTSWIN